MCLSFIGKHKTLRQCCVIHDSAQEVLWVGGRGLSKGVSSAHIDTQCRCDIHSVSLLSDPPSLDTQTHIGPSGYRNTCESHVWMLQPASTLLKLVHS